MAAVIRRQALAVLVMVVAVVLGCRQEFLPGRCHQDADCPSGMVCAQEFVANLYHRCVAPGTDGGRDVQAGGDADAGSDGDTGVDAVPTCDAACGSTTPVCDQSTLTCVECLTSDDCRLDPARPVCNGTAHACVGCLTGGDCHDPANPVCDGATRTCVGCVATTDCTTNAAKPLCDTVAKSCVGCLANGDCASATAPICDLTSHACAKCATDQQCQAKDATTPACEVSTGTCFPCVDSKKHCTAAAPICDAHACRACAKDAECTTAYGGDPGLCVTGRCPASAQVIYLQNSTSCTATVRGNGTTASPFCFSSDATAALSVGRSTILVRGPQPLTEPLAPSFAGEPVTIAGQNGARLTIGLGTQPLVVVTTGDVTLRDLAISGGTAIGVSATGGILRMTRCMVLNNGDGGIKTSNAAFDITNSVVAGNMGSAAVSLGPYTGIGPTRFAFNTVVVTNAGTGVFCGQNYSVGGLLVSSNGTSFGGTCTTDTTSSTDPPQFDPARSYHLTATSPCRDKAGTANLPPDDIDGDSRPQGPAADCGADEYAP